MHRISLIINEIYHKFLPIAERSGITINLSCPDPLIQIDNPEQLKADLEQSLNDVLNRTNASEIQISVDRKAIIISDPETILSHTACALLSRNFLKIDSRVGFGTTITIALQRPQENLTETSKPPMGALEAAETPLNSLEPIEPASAPKPAKNASKSPKKHSPKKKVSISKAKTTKSKSSRELNRAARQTARKVHKIAKKAKKSQSKK